jgi:hypothetical protein
MFLLRQPTRSSELVFLSKTGKRLSQPVLSGYWARQRRAGARLLSGQQALRRSPLYKLGLSSRAIGAQMGWSEKAVDSLLQVYGHIDLIALAEVDALYENNVVPLRTAEAG